MPADILESTQEQVASTVQLYYILVFTSILIRSIQCGVLSARHTSEMEFLDINLTNH